MKGANFVPDMVRDRWAESVRRRNMTTMVAVPVYTMTQTSKRHEWREMKLKGITACNRSNTPGIANMGINIVEHTEPATGSHTKRHNHLLSRDVGDLVVTLVDSTSNPLANADSQPNNRSNEDKSNQELHAELLFL